MGGQFSFTSQGQAASAELYPPAGGVAAKGLVVIAYGSDGLTDNLSGPWATMIRGFADGLAAAGHTAIIPDWLSITKTTPGPAVLDSIHRNRGSWQEALSDAIDSASGLPGASPIGLLGFSLGGHLCLRLRSKASVLVEHFAPVLDGIGSAGMLSHAQVHHGEADNFPGTGFVNAEAIKRTLEGEGTSTELFAYPGAGHGFGGDDQANVDARKLSSERTIDFFNAHL